MRHELTKSLMELNAAFESVQGVRNTVLDPNILAGEHSQLITPLQVLKMSNRITLGLF